MYQPEASNISLCMNNYRPLRPRVTTSKFFLLYHYVHVLRSTTRNDVSLAGTVFLFHTFTFPVLPLNLTDALCNVRVVPPTYFRVLFIVSEGTSSREIYAIEVLGKGSGAGVGREVCVD